MSVAIPEFDGRIITVPFSIKEMVDDGDTLGTPVTAYRTVPDRTERVAGVAVRLARLRAIPPADRRVAIVLSAYPTKRSRIGNAVALDTPASIIDLLGGLRAAGYRVDRIPADGDALMAELIDAFSYERETLTAAQLHRAAGSGPAPPTASGSRGYRRHWPSRWGKGGARRREPSTATTRPGTWCSPASTWVGSSSPCSRRAASARTPSPCTTRPICRRPTTTWRSTGGSTWAGEPMP